MLDASSRRSSESEKLERPMSSSGLWSGLMMMMMMISINIPIIYFLIEKTMTTLLSDLCNIKKYFFIN
jgi:hypothetical protein